LDIAIVPVSPRPELDIICAEEELQTPRIVHALSVEEIVEVVLEDLLVQLAILYPDDLSRRVLVLQPLGQPLEVLPRSVDHEVSRSCDYLEYSIIREEVL